MKFIPLANTGKKTGTVRVAEVMQMSPFGGRGELNEDRRQVPTFGEYTLAAEIEGKIKPRQPPAEEKDAKKADQSDGDDPQAEAKASAGEKKSAEPKPPKEVDLHVVLVADIDMLSDLLFPVAQMGESQENEINFQFDNVASILNVLDKPAGDEASSRSAIAARTITR